MKAEVRVDNEDISSTMFRGGNGELHPTIILPESTGEPYLIHTSSALRGLGLGPGLDLSRKAFSYILPFADDHVCTLPIVPDHSICSYGV